MNLINLRLPKYQQLQAQMRKELGKKIQRASRLLEASISDLAEQMDSGNPKQILNFALDLARPYLQSLGLRISRLTFQDVEVVLPGKRMQQDAQQNFDEGAVVSAALFAYRKLWRKNAPKGPFSMKISSFEFERMLDLRGPLFLRVNLSPLQREAVYAELAQQKKSNHESVVQVFDPEDRVVAKLLVRSELQAQRVIGWK